MKDFLPEKDFKWVEGEDLERIRNDLNGFLSTLHDESETGYFFEVTLNVPPEKHDYLNDFPPCPVRRNVTREEISEFQGVQVEDYEIKNVCFKTSKLVADLNTKRVVIHYRNLQMYIKLGLQVETIHNAVSFFQRPWMEPYINYNTERRTASTTDYEKDFYKLLNNAAFGKCCEQKRNRKGMSIVRTKTELQYYLNKPTFQRVIPINEEKGIYLVEKKKLSVH